jgi:hypothetical protein
MLRAIEGRPSGLTFRGTLRLGGGNLPIPAPPWEDLQIDSTALLEATTPSMVSKWRGSTSAQASTTHHGENPSLHRWTAACGLLRDIHHSLGISYYSQQFEYSNGLLDTEIWFEWVWERARSAFRALAMQKCFLTATPRCCATQTSRECSGDAVKDINYPSNMRTLENLAARPIEPS